MAPLEPRRVVTKTERPNEIKYSQIAFALHLTESFQRLNCGFPPTRPQLVTAFPGCMYWDDRASGGPTFTSINTKADSLVSQSRCTGKVMKDITLSAATPLGLATTVGWTHPAVSGMPLPDLLLSVIALFQKIQIQRILRCCWFFVTSSSIAGRRCVSAIFPARIPDDLIWFSVAHTAREGRVSLAIYCPRGQVETKRNAI